MQTNAVMDIASTPTAEDLMQRVRGGSRQAFLELMEAWQGSLYRFFRLSGIDHHESEDCIQETFLRVFTYRKRYRPSGDGSFRSFLFRIGRNVSIDSHRRRKRGREALPLERCLDREPGFDPTSLWCDALDVKDAVLSLPQRLRLVVGLNIYEGLSYCEIARALEIPLGTVKSRMHHAMLQLRETLRVKITA
ncbi:MAG: RNA polymerase sigma factor [Planctomycetes bacterium]|nr:RNA polymerase sigma factor [Planctomycetota bacterium]